MDNNICTKEEGWRCAIRKAQEGDKDALETLVSGNIGLIYMVIKRFSGRGHEQEDLFQIGAIGLIKAIHKFDVSRELSFSTYAVPMIMGEIRRFLRDDGMIHVSRQMKENARKIAQVKEQLKKMNNCDPTMEELIRETGLSAEEILMALEATAEVQSIYQPLGNGAEGETMRLADLLEDSSRNESELIDRLMVVQLLEKLEEKERKLIELRYLEGKTQTESACILGMNQVAVSRLEKKVLLSMRKQI